jgi:hypothetical protein
VGDGVRTETELRAALARLNDRYVEAYQRVGAPQGYLNGLFMAVETLRWVLGDNPDHAYADTLEGPK